MAAAPDIPESGRPFVIEPLLPLVDDALAFIGPALTFVGAPFPLVGLALTFVAGAVPFVSPAGARFQLLAQLLGGLAVTTHSPDMLAPRQRPATLAGHRCHRPGRRLGLHTDNPAEGGATC